MKERLRLLGLVLRMKDDRLPKIVLFGQPSGATRKAGRPCLGWEDVINKDLKEMGTSWEGVKREALNRLGWRRSLVLQWVISSSSSTIVLYINVTSATSFMNITNTTNVTNLKKAILYFRINTGSWGMGNPPHIWNTACLF